MSRLLASRPLLGCVLALGSCTCEPETDATADAAVEVLSFEPGPAVDVDETLPDPLWAAQLARLPQSAQNIVLLHPEKLRTALASGALRERVLSAFSSASAPLALLDEVLAEIDASRPIAVAAFAVPNEEAYADARFGGVVDPELVPAFIHNRVLIPTRSANELVSKLEPLAIALGLESRTVDPELADLLPPNVRVFELAKGRDSPPLSVVVIPDFRELRLEIAWGRYTGARRHEATLLRVAAPPAEHPWEETAALRHLLVERPLVGTYYNPEGVAILALALALVEAAQAVSAAPSELAPATWARGLSVALVGFDVLDPRDRIQADAALSIELDRQLHLRSTTSLTQLGATVGDEALPAAGHVFDPKGPPPVLWLQSGESMRANAMTAEPLRWGRQLSTETLRERWTWSGGIATHAALTNARWPTLRTLARVLPAEEFDIAALLPDAYTVVVPRAGSEAEQFQVALALDYGPATDTSEIRAQIEELPWPDHAKASVSEHEIAGRGLILVGIGVDPATILDVDNPRRIGQVERVEIGQPRPGAALLPPAWASWFETIGPAWAAWADVVGEARYVQVHRGAALIGHATIALDEDGSLADPAPRAFSPRAPAPVSMSETERGWHCLRDIPHVAVDQLGTVSERYSSPPSRLAAALGIEQPDWSVLAGLVGGENEASRAHHERSVEALDATLAAIEPLLACGEADPASEATARRVRASWLATLAQWADGVPEPERAQRWANDGCALGSARACARADTMRARASVAIPVRPWLSYPLLGTPDLELVLGTREVSLDGRPLAPASDLESAIGQRLAARPLLGREIAIFADASVSYTRLRAAASAALDHGLLPRIVLRGPAGRIMALRVVDRAELARRQAADAPVSAVRLGRGAIQREPGITYELADVLARTTWGQLSERLLDFGALPASPTEAERARHEAVGTAAAVPELILGP